MQQEQDKSLSEVHQSVDVSNRKSRWRTLLAYLGPAYLVSVGYMDPGNWATDIAGGSRFGYSLIWVLLLSNWVALLLQSLASRLGIVKGWDLAQASRQQYPAWINISLYTLAEIAIAATDLAEIIGMAIGLNLLFHLPLLYGVLITVLDTFLLLFLIKKGIRKIELFIVSLVSIIGFSFLTEMFIVKPEIMPLLGGFMPSALQGESLYIAIGIIGATVMPHNLYLHSSLVQTRKITRDDKGIRKALKFNFIDSALALNAAFFVNAAILVLAAAAFHRNGYNNVADISNAHELLQGIFGSLAPVLFAIALIASGQSSTITGTLAGQIVMEGYLNLRISPWMRRVITRMLAVVPAVITIIYFGEKQLGELLILSQVILSLQLGFAIIPLIHFTSSKNLMGSYTISNWIKWAAWACALIILGLNIKLVAEEISSFIDSEYGNIFWLKALLIIFLAYTAYLLLYVTFSPIFMAAREKKMVPHLAAQKLKLEKAESFKRIGIAVDFSKFDELGIRHALGMGTKQSTYILFHIVESAAASRFGNEAFDIETQHDREWMESYLKDLKDAGYNASYELGFGNRAENLAALAQNHKVQILVMGAHGHAGIKDLIFGSTVDAVRHKLNIPILVVR